MIIDPRSLKITDDIFEKLNDKKKFGDIIRQEFDYDAGQVYLEPKYYMDLLLDAYQSYQWDIKRLV